MKIKNIITNLTGKKSNYNILVQHKAEDIEAIGQSLKIDKQRIKQNKDGKYILDTTYKLKPCKVKYKDGDVYMGEVNKNFMPNGKGKMKYANGGVLKGFFVMESFAMV